jgi:hypothetical protein
MVLAAGTSPAALPSTSTPLRVIDRQGALHIPVSWPFSFLRSRFSIAPPQSLTG